MKSSTTQTIIVTFFLLIIPTSFAAPPKLEDSFTQCLTTFKPSDPKFPIQNFTYTQENPNFLIILNNYVRNLRYFNGITRKPVAIVAAAHFTHIQATINCAKKLGLQLRIRSGGHDYDGMSYLSTVDFVVLDMFNLRSIEIDPKLDTACVQSGATLGEIYYNVANKSNNLRGFPAGICPGLGARGHFSGGGYGNMMRKYGLSIDNNIDAKTVDANARVLDRSSMGEDLFWAIRGGGAASFCVVLAWKIKLVPVPEKVTVSIVDLGRSPVLPIFNVETVGNRGGIQYSSNWFVPGEEAASDCLSQTERVFKAMSPYVSKNPREAFLNYRDVDIGKNLNSTYEEGKSWFRLRLELIPTTFSGTSRAFQCT
ncbi:hypothetical protein ARALYDRAFT_473604 [Arabidopsis lyrata subsp. lyrata]|uniref:FAD-binding PCMH-type domain-containing protein n=1 Tax=Arabidopsis lyrata subsp. lyrata TaxID=81972 RepID=D7KK76_ARALL|nr:hypothetical protein ARALYDRAFT_473604 [Arabidopsis lyrata subsp. lyrata]